MVEGDYAPGDHITHQLITQSDMNESAMDLQVGVFELEQSPEGIIQAVEENPSARSYSAKSFFRVSPANYHLDPGKTATVEVDGDIPSNAMPGGKYAIIQVHSVPKENNDTKNSGVSVSAAINTVVRIAITGGELQKTGSIESLVVESAPKNQQDINLTFKNTGNIHYPVIVDVILKDSRGVVLANTTQSPGKVYPTATRIFKLSLKPNEKLAPGKYTISSTISLEDGIVLTSKDTEFEVKN
ncbi:MAG: hypothetical protein PHQ34_08285 [Methanothrix sp.]|nr:hypothetical protein [Methanothrix sp.]